jgi:sec-independent protein translocase protein TatA
MGPIGVQEMIAIFVIALVLFGPKKLPELGRMLGKGLSEFRRAKSELKATFESHLNELERETRLPPISESSPTNYSSTATDYSSPRYSYPYEDQGTYETGNSHEVVPSESLPSTHALDEPAAHQPELQPVEAIAHAQPVAGTVARGSSTLHEEPRA